MVPVWCRQVDDSFTTSIFTVVSTVISFGMAQKIGVRTVIFVIDRFPTENGRFLSKSDLFLIGSDRFLWGTDRFPREHLSSKPEAVNQKQ